MKRWLIVLGRSGTVLVAIGLALMLVSLIPLASTGSFSAGGTIAPNSFQVIWGDSSPFGKINGTFYSLFFSTLTPQQELIVEIECDDKIDVYLLKINNMDLIYNFSGTDRNVSLLEEFLQVNPDLIGWQSEMIEGVVDYIPTEVIYATLIFSNPSPNRISIEYTGRILRLLAPTGKVQTLAVWAIPIGFVLALPWFLDLRKSKKIYLSS